MKLTEIDLNLMLVMHVVLEERSVTRAAKRLHVTPPAVSNSLGRLRELLGDPLFVRQGRGVVPTPFTLELESELAGAIASMERVVTGKVPLDPAQLERSFVIACSDVDRLCAVPRIVDVLSERMPRAALHVVSIDRLLAAGGLASGGADVSIAPHRDPLPPGLHDVPLYRDRPVMVVRADHPGVGARLTPRVFNELSHIDIRMALGDPGIGHAIAERGLAAAGLRRRIAVTVPDCLTAAMVAARTDHAAGVPKRLADQFAASLGLRVLRFPGPPFEFRMQLVWHDRTHADEPAAWFRRAVQDAFA